MNPHALRESAVTRPLDDDIVQFVRLGARLLGNHLESTTDDALRVEVGRVGSPSLLRLGRALTAKDRTLKLAKHALRLEEKPLGQSVTVVLFGAANSTLQEYVLGRDSAVIGEVLRPGCWLVEDPAGEWFLSYGSGENAQQILVWRSENAG